MPMDNKKLLIVEADSDKQFIDRFLKKEQIKLGLNIKVVTPKDINPNQHYTTQGGVFNELSLILKQFADGEITQLGILIDMDYRLDKPLPIKEFTLNRLSYILSAEKFEIAQDTAQGIFFKSEDFDNPIGVWLMPNNQDEGYLETWVKMAMSADQQSHFTQIENFIQSLGTNHFKNLTTAMDKARIYTWLATQSKPTQDLSKALALADPNTATYQNFKNWLITTFG